MSNEAQRWSAAIRASSKPAYVALADALAEDVHAGKLAAHQRLPTLRALAKALELNFSTVARGYAEAERRGLIDARAGSGSYVRAVLKSGPVRRAPPAMPVDMSMNMPPEPAAPELLERLRSGFASLAHDLDPYAWLRYQGFGGDAADREAGAHFLSDQVTGLDASRVLVCPGGQGALLGLFSLLARPGDHLACEAVTYPGIKGLAAQLGIRLVGLPADDAGLEPEAFAALCAADLPKALYLNPTLNNPTTAVMAVERRVAVAEIARRYNVPIIEDDPYIQLLRQPPPTLASMAPELTFYVSSFAKCLGAGLRVGYVSVPSARYTARLSAIMRTTTVMAAPPLVRLATRWIVDGTAAAMTRAIRDESMARQALARQILRKAQYRTRMEAFHLWLTVPRPWTRGEFAEHLRAHGVAAVVSDTFTVSGSAPEAVRICLGGAGDRDACRHSLEIVEDAIEQPPAVVSKVM